MPKRPMFTKILDPDAYRERLEESIQGAVDRGLEKLKRVCDAFQASQMKLSLCKKPHDFQRDPDNSQQARCSKCQGVVSDREAYWYTEGLKDSSKEQ